MEDEEWEDVLLCSYLTSPDKLGPKHFSDAQFNKLLETKVWAEPVSENDNNEGSALLHLIKCTFKTADSLQVDRNTKRNEGQQTITETGITGTHFLSNTKRPGFLFMFSWGNTVVHAKKNGEISMLDDETAGDQPVQFILEHFDHLFVFRDYDHPRIYKKGRTVAVIQEIYGNFTSKGVDAADKYVYYTRNDDFSLVKVARDFSHSIVPGTERTSDFVVLKDERLFWITKYCILHNSEKSKDIGGDLGMEVYFESLMVLTNCYNVFVSVENKHFLLVSPELEIIDSVVNQSFGRGFQMRANRRFKSLTVVLVSCEHDILGIVIKNGKIHLMSSVPSAAELCSLSPLKGFWIAAGEQEPSILKLQL